MELTDQVSFFHVQKFQGECKRREHLLHLDRVKLFWVLLIAILESARKVHTQGLES